MASPSAGPPSQPLRTASITIANHYPNPENNLFDVIFDNSTRITTTVTADPAVVSRWITTLLSTSLSSHVIGLDIEWRPNFSKNHDNAVATLQLCAKPYNGPHTCLIFQILYSPRPVPRKLIEFLGNGAFTFVGAGIEVDSEKLIGDYDLYVARKGDLGEIAKRVGVSSFGGKPSVGLKELAKVVLGVEVSKPKRVTLSRWDQGWLSYEQIQYACVDAFLSYEIGAQLC